MILVVGSSGLLGGEICKLLARKGIPLRVLVRCTTDPAKVEQLRSFGSSIALGDLNDPASVEDACRGIHGIICTASALMTYQNGKNDFRSVDNKGITGLVDAATKAGVSRFIFPSYSSSIDVQSPLLSAKRNVEKYIRESILVYTIIRSSFFIETWFSPTAGFDPVKAKATIYGEGTNTIRWISCRNVAQLIVNSLYNPDVYYSTLNLAGPEALSPLQVVSQFEAAGQRTFEITHIQEKQLIADQLAAKDPLRRSWISLFLSYAHGERNDTQPCSVSYPAHLISIQEYGQTFYERRRKNLVPYQF
jgi:uncharacterized protein YbjT (DUF2867 family)